MIEEDLIDIREGNMLASEVSDLLEVWFIN